MTHLNQKKDDMLIPKKGSLHAIVLDKLIESKDGVTYLDFIGTGVTEENIDQIMCDLRYGMFEAENDNELKLDA